MLRFAGRHQVVDGGLARRSAPHTLTPAEQPATKTADKALVVILVVFLVVILVFFLVQTGFLKRKRGGKKMTGVDDLVRTSSA